MRVALQNGVLTLSTIARTLGVRECTVSNWKQGVYRATEDRRLKLANLLSAHACRGSAVADELRGTKPGRSLDSSETPADGPGKLSDSLLEVLACPSCLQHQGLRSRRGKGMGRGSKRKGGLEHLPRERVLLCRACSLVYPLEKGVPDLTKPQPWWASRSCTANVST